MTRELREYLAREIVEATAECKRYNDPRNRERLYQAIEAAKSCRQYDGVDQLNIKLDEIATTLQRGVNEIHR